MIPFTGLALDRADHVRADPERLAAAAADPAARALVLDGLLPVTGDGSALTWQALPEPAGELVFLGLEGTAPRFAPVPASGDTRPAYEMRPVWDKLGLLSAEDLALYGGARSIVDWHARHRFCAQCGAPTTLAKGGWQRNCTACPAQHFPRTDPVAITLIEHDGELLLGRGHRYPPRSYSALAGFIEPGESVEEAVAREIFEEVGVRVGAVRYVASQPWPFPSQLMIGCHALAEGRALTLDETEIEDARWFTRAQVAEAIQLGVDAKSFLAPPPRAIAWHLLKWWLEQGR